MTKRLLVCSMVLFLAGFLAQPAWAQSSGGNGWDLEVYDTASGNNTFTAVSGSQTTVAIRMVASTVTSGDCGAGPGTVLPDSCWSVNFLFFYDSSLLSVASVTDLFPANFSGTIDTSVPGQISVFKFAFSGAVLPTGDVMQVTFNVTGASGSSSNLFFTSVALADTGGTNICGTFTPAGTTGSGDYWDTEYDGVLNIVSLPGITVTPTSGLVTTEAGGTDSFTVVLDAPPTADVVIGISSSDTTEGTVSPASLTFTTGNWNAPQTVTVTGVDDSVDDGDIAYTIVTAAATSSDGNYNGINPADVTATNTDDDTAAINVTPTTLTIPEGSNDTFTVVLGSEPTADVTVNLVSSDTSRATISPASMTFTSGNWSSAQTATVSAVQDAIDNGDGNVTIQNTASSGDSTYNAIDPDDVAVTVQDDDTFGITVNPTSGLITTEAGGTDTFTVVLDSEPTADVTIGLTSSDTTEGTVSPGSVTFTSGNWNVAQTVTVTGVDDAVADGDVAYTIVTAAATSGDANYSGLNPADVSVTNQDDDSPGVQVTPTTVNVAEGGATDTYSVVLNTLPTNDVTITITTGGQTTVNPTLLTFTSGNGTTPQTVTVTAVDDAVLEGNHTDTISHTAVSLDSDYDAATIADVTANITDN